MKYEVGDKVLIRQWDDMVAEFGVDKDGDIKTHPISILAGTMKEFCGTAATIIDQGECYEISEDAGVHWWPEEAIERKADEQMGKKFKVGDEVKVRGIIDFSDSHYDQYRVSFKVGKTEFCRWCHESNIELIYPEPQQEAAFKLETGHVVETRNKKRFVFLDRPNGKRLMQLDDNYGWLNGEAYDRNLLRKGDNKWDVMKVYAGGNSLNCCLNANALVWQRIEPKKMTMSEVEAALGYPVEIMEES